MKKCEKVWKSVESVQHSAIRDEPGVNTTKIPEDQRNLREINENQRNRREIDENRAKPPPAVI